MRTALVTQMLDSITGKALDRLIPKTQATAMTMRRMR